MKISVITVCRNAEDTIEETIKSVLAQTYKNIEFIIIDGNSTDNTLNIINKYKTDINYLLSENDTGIYNAMNKGVNAATGDILYFLNANDLLYSDDIFQIVVNTFNKNNIDVLWGDVEFIDNNRNHVGFDYYKMRNKLDFLKQNICHQSIFYKADCFKKYGLYDESYILYADYDINLRFLFKNKLKGKYINKIISKFDITGVSQSKEEESVKLQKLEKDRIVNSYFDDDVKNCLKIHSMMYKYVRTPYKILLKINLFNNLINYLPYLKLNIKI